MFCARCGQQIPETSEICPLCGREANIEWQRSSAVERAVPVTGSPATIQGPVGVGGWLLFFCLMITILTPAAIGLQTLTMGQGLSRAYAIDLARAAYGMIV